MEFRIWPISGELLVVERLCYKMLHVMFLMPLSTSCPFDSTFSLHTPTLPHLLFSVHLARSFGSLLPENKKLKCLGVDAFGSGLERFGAETFSVQRAIRRP